MRIRFSGSRSRVPASAVATMLDVMPSIVKLRTDGSESRTTVAPLSSRLTWLYISKMLSLCEAQRIRNPYRPSRLSM